MNDHHENDRTWSDALGLALFFAGAFACVLLTQALLDAPGSAEGAGGTKAMGHALLWAGGATPIFLVGTASLALGALLFLDYVGAVRALRHLGGIFGVALGVSVVLGGFSESAAGAFGAWMGGSVASAISAPVAALVGLGCASLAAWLAWLTPSGSTAWERMQEMEKPVVPLHAKADGVTRQESAALAFLEEPSAFPEVATSPYPEDVRSRGEIPEGAAVLGAEETTQHEESTETASKTGLSEATSGGAEAQLGADQEAHADRSEDESADAEPASEDLALGDESTALESENAARAEDGLSEAATGEGSDSVGLDSAPAERSEPAGGFDTTEDDDTEEFETDAEEEELDEEEEEDDSDAVDDEEEYEEEEELDEEEEEDDSDAVDGEEESEEEELEEEEEEDDDSDSDLDEAEEASDESVEEKSADDVEDPELAALGEDMEYEDAAALSEGEDVVMDDEIPGAEPADEEPRDGGAEAPTEEEAPEEEPADVAEEQGDLFGSSDDVTEPEVILEPASKPSGEKLEVLLQAADLFLERDRVAVSLLQRQFRLDFEESCAILDELQEMGLIGPYLGGSRRDILLTRDEWLLQVGNAT